MSTVSYAIKPESFEKLSSCLYDLARIRDVLRCIDAAADAQVIDFTVALSAASLAGDRLSTICDDVDGVVINAKEVTVNDS